jgi:hypothetical protein
MTVKFQADANLNQIILLAVRRREPALDFQTAMEGGLPGVNDPEVLARAAGERRILVTHDRKTMPRHFSTFITEATSAGVLIVPQHLPVAAVVDDLLLIWYATEAEEWINQIRSLPL